MSEQQMASGADLVRQTLAAYKTGRIPGTGAQTGRPRRRRAERGDGRDPVAFGAILERLRGEQGWAAGVHGGSILDDWPTLCPQYVGRVQPVHYDAASGRLDLRPGSHAYASQLRLLGAQLCKQINDKIGSIVVRSIRVLPVGEVAEPVAAMPGVGSIPAAVSAGPVKTRETASPGYRHVLALHHNHRPERPGENALIAAARAALDRRVADPSRREPREAFVDGMAVLEALRADPTAEQQARDEEVRQAAIRRARAQRAGHDTVQPVHRLFESA